MVSYRFGPFRLVPDQRRLERDGTAIALTPKAFDLLVALVQHHTRALSKDEILALVWSGSVVEEGNLAQQVLLLRRALADAGECVATVPRHGYRFVASVIEEDDDATAPATSTHCIVWDGREYPLREGITVIGRGEDVDLRIPLRPCRAITRAWSSAASTRRSRISEAATARGEEPYAYEDPLGFLVETKSGSEQHRSSTAS